MTTQEKAISLTVLICVHSTNYYYDSLLLKSLESLVNQTYKNFDTLVVLDECWSNTKKSLDIFSKKLNLKLVEKNKREGLSFAKNFGLNLIDTDYVCFLDADDLYCNDKLEKQIQVLKNDNSIDFLGTQAWNIYNDDEQNLKESCFRLGQYETHDEISKNIMNENFLTHGSMMIRKKCIDELGGYRNVKGMEDWDLWKRAIEKGYKFRQIQERLYIYRIGTSNIR